MTLVNRRKGLVRRAALQCTLSAFSLTLFIAFASAQAAFSKGASPPIQITLDTSEAPEMASWAAHAKELCEKAYPLILDDLGAPGFKPPDKTKITFKKMNGIAYTSGSGITCGAAWFTEHPDDYGAVIHELCHVVQAYHRPVPGWVTEGIADYVRWFHWEPANRRPRIRNPERAKYTDSYQTTAAFFDWIVRTKDKTFINRLNAAARKGDYEAELFEKFAGKPVDVLWSEFVASRSKARPSASPAARTVYPIKVSSNGRYFVDGKGKPFFWLGTTQWQLFREYKLEDARTILEKTRDKGFAFAQVMLMGVGDGTKANVYGEKPWIDDNPLTPNEGYFKNVDAVVRIARERRDHFHDLVPPALPQAYHRR